MSGGFGGFAEFIESMRGGPEDKAGPLTRYALAPDRPDEPVDHDERALGLAARGYAPGRVADLSQKYADTLAELEAEREKIEAGRRAEARVTALRQAGRIGALEGWQRLDGDYGDQAQADRLERRAAGLARQIESAQAMIAPQRQALDGDGLEAAASRAAAAHREYVSRSRAAMAAAAAGAPAPSRRPRPFGYASRGGLADPGPCAECVAVGATAEESLLIHADPSPAPVPDDWQPPDDRQPQPDPAETWPVRYSTLGHEVTRVRAVNHHAGVRHALPPEDRYDGRSYDWAGREVARGVDNAIVGVW